MMQETSETNVKCFLEPTEFCTAYGAFQLSMYRPSKMLLRELEIVFPNSLPSSGLESVVIIPTCQKSKLDLLGISPAVAEEKDRLLENFFKLCYKLKEKLFDLKYWFDFCDPASGLPMFGTGGSVFSDVEAFERLLRYKTSSAGGCKVVYHPVWSTGFYPSTMFTNCPVDVFFATLQSLSLTS